MKGLQEYLIPYLISQGVSILILWTAWKKPKWARLLLSVLFLYAGMYNLWIGFVNPAEYLGFADLAIPWYSRFIRGWFSTYNQIVIPLIALGQLLIAAGMLLKGGWFRWACIGAISFLVAIAPLMVGSAFPFSISVSVAIILLWKKGARDFVWIKDQQRVKPSF